MDKCENDSRAEELTCFLMKLDKGKNVAGLRKQANRLISHVTPDDIEKAEHRLVKIGLPIKKIQQLSSSFVLMGILDGNADTLKPRLPESHILRKVMAEHEMMRCFIADLEDVASQIQQKEKLASTSSEFMRLSHIVEHLNSLEEHMDRENDVLFPVLRELGWKSLFDHIESEHTYILMSVRDLVKLVMAFDKMPLSSFKTRLMATVRYLGPMLREHLFREDQAIFPLAMSMVQDEAVWKKLRTICNEIDYCGIHL